MPRATPEPRYPATRSTADAPEEELELGQVEVNVAVPDVPMDVEPVKQEEDAAKAAVAEPIDPASTWESAVKPSDSPTLSSHTRRTPSPAPSMAVDEQKPDVNLPSPQSPRASVKAEPIDPPVKSEVKAELSVPTRPRRFFEDHPPSRETIKAERASPGPRSEARYHWRGDRYDQAQSSPASSHHMHTHVKGSPHSPRPPFKHEERPHEHSKLSSATHTPSIPAQELAGSAAHSPRSHLDAPQLERAISGQEPSHAHKSGFMRMGPRTEHGNGPPHGRPPYGQRESTQNQQNEPAQQETLYSSAELQEVSRTCLVYLCLMMLIYYVSQIDRKHKQRKQLERESWSLSRQWYNSKHDLELAVFDLRSAQSKTKLAEEMLDLAKAGKLGINHPTHLAAAWNEERADVAMY